MGDLNRLAPHSSVESWGRYPRLASPAVPLFWTNEPLPHFSDGTSVLPHGKGRSYGDVCLNEGGVCLATTRLDRFLAFDPATGILRCEAGVTLEAILAFSVPRGWFLPVTPGTKYVTIAGAVANDVHGKNHHRAGTLGEHVTQFELLRSDGTRKTCSSQVNADWFAATIGGLGLTGLITWVELRLTRIESAFVDQEKVRFENFDAFLSLARESETSFANTVAWIDSTARGKNVGRGLFIRGNVAPKEAGLVVPHARIQALPFEVPRFVLNPWSIRAFNALYYRQRTGSSRLSYDAFFYPLDAISHWNRLYGKRGFLQHQFVIPFAAAHAVKELLVDISRSGTASFLAVLKIFGNRKPAGLMSFAREGITLALDFRYEGKETLSLLDRVDATVRDAGGAIYPAKDARMSAETFRTSFPRLEEFAKFVDPGFSSSLWRRLHR